MRTAYSADLTAPETDNDNDIADAKSNERSSLRIQTTFRIARVLADADEGLAHLRDISDDGLGLRLYMPVLLGDVLVVQLGEDVAVTGRVVWTSGSNCGIKLDEAFDSVTMLSELARESSRATARPMRLPVTTKVVARGTNGTRLVELVDVSQRGMKVRHDGSLTEGISVKITLPSGTEAHGIVRWSSNGLAGLMLFAPLSVEKLGSVRNL